MQNSLFPRENNPTENHLPYDGAVYYHGNIIEKRSADFYFQQLLATAAWQHDEAVIYGKHIQTKRKVAWYGDSAFHYTYSNVTRTAHPWTPTILQLKNQVEKHSGETFNSCLLNLYHNGNEGMAWHSDDEAMLKKHGTIAGLSLGAERKIVFKHKQSQTKVELFLEHGSLMMMKNETQDYWLHSIPTTQKIHTPRISLTFRNIVKQSSHANCRYQTKK